MKISHLVNSEIDKVKWDECIRNAPNGNVYAYSWYLDIVSKNWCALVTDDYSNVFPLTWRKKVSVKYLCQPPFSQQLGLFSRDFITPDLLNNFINNIPKEYKLIEINLNKLNIEIPAHFTLHTNTTYELDLAYPYSDIKNGFSDNTKRNIKKAISNNVCLSNVVKPDDMINLFRSNRGRHIATLQEKDYKILQKLINLSLLKKCGTIWGAYNNNELCAAAFFIEANGKAVFLFSALNDKGRDNSAMFYIVDNFIRLNTEKPLVLDFEGSNDENIARFYKGFGSKKYSYFQINSNNLPYLVNHFHKIYKRLKYS